MVCWNHGWPLVDGGEKPWLTTLYNLLTAIELFNSHHVSSLVAGVHTIPSAPGFLKQPKKLSLTICICHCWLFNIEPAIASITDMVTVARWILPTMLAWLLFPLAGTLQPGSAQVMLYFNLVKIIIALTSSSSGVICWESNMLDEWICRILNMLD